MKRTLALVMAVGALWPMTGTAQDMGWSTIIPSVTGTDQLGIVLREQMRPAPSRGGRPLPVARRAVAPDAAALRYQPSKERRAANLARFVEKTRAVDPAGAKDLAKLFASGDFIEKIGRALAPADLRVDNVADAYTVYWINAWQATRGRNDTPSRIKHHAVRMQASRALAASPEFTGAGDAAKQELAESLLVQAALIDTAVEQAKGDRARLAAVGAAVAKGARGMGLDLATMELTEHGFGPAQSGRNGPVSGAEQVQVGDAGATPGRGSGAPYSLVAAAGGRRARAAAQGQGAILPNRTPL